MFTSYVAGVRDAEVREADAGRDGERWILWTSSSYRGDWTD